jgi:mono/diheme cytochrome c family protein
LPALRAAVTPRGRISPPAHQPRIEEAQMASGKIFNRISAVVITGAVISACGGGGEDETTSLPATDTTTMAAAPVVPAPITDTTAMGAAPGMTTPAPAPGATPPAAAPPAATPAPKGAAPAPAQGGGGNAAEGQQLFASAAPCVSCHGPNGAGTALGPALNDNQWLWFTSRPTQDQLFTLIKTGVATPKQHPAPMPAMGGAALTDAQVRSLAAYVLSISGG